MKNKKLILLTIIALSCMSAALNAWRDYDDDYYRGRGPVGRTVRGAGDVVEDTGEVAGEIAATPFRILGGGRERREERRPARYIDENIETEEIESQY